MIKEQLSGTTRILVTHATHFLSEVDRIVVMDTEVAADNTRVVGKITHTGTYSELLLKGSSVCVTVRILDIRQECEITATSYFISM